MLDFELIPFNIQFVAYLVVALFLISIFLFVYFLSFYKKGKKFKQKDDDSLMFDIAYFQQIGKRPYQEDSLYISPMDEIAKNGLVAVVADGMGGLQYGDVISKRVVDTIQEWYPMSFFACDNNAKLIRKLSNDIYEEYKQNGGSTLVLANIHNNYMNYYSVGDSNIILIRNEVTTVLNQKQNYLNILVNKLVKQGKQTSAAYSDSKAKALTDFIGNYNPVVKYTNRPIRLFDGDTIILCSDGVTDTIKWQSLSSFVDEKAATMAFNIKHAVNVMKNHHQDNFTAIVIRVKRNLYD